MIMSQTMMIQRNLSVIAFLRHCHSFFSKNAKYQIVISDFY
jgi:hypothetical protein